MAYTPTRDVVIGVICVFLGCLASGASVHAARRTRNWLFLVCALGSAAFVLGVAGQRVFPTEDARRIDPFNAAHKAPGAWEAGVSIPVVNVSAPPVAVGGLLLAVVGLSLVLFFEAVPEGDRPAPRRLPPFEDGESA